MWRGPARAIALVLVGLLAALSPSSTPPAHAEEPDVVVFWAEGCPYCEVELAFLDELSTEFPNLTVARYEVKHDESNRRLFVETMAALGLEATGVPTTVMGARVWVGFDAERAEDIHRAVAALSRDDVEATTELVDRSIIEVPLIGPIDVASHSLLASTAIIALVDGFNPCSLWVLSILLALVLNTRSRRRVLMVGLTFLAVTATLYGVYIVGFYSVLSYIGYVDWIRIGVAVLALAFGLLNVKDYFAFRRGPSLTIADEKKPEIYRRMRALAVPDRPLVSVLGGTALLAVGVSLIETPCTAGFPVLWADLMAQSGVGSAGAGLLFGVYMLVFLVDELLVLAAAVIAMRVTKVTERHGRLLKLVGGMVMLTLAGVLVVAPELMESVAGAVTVFIVAALLTVLVLVVDRVLGLSAMLAAKTAQPRTTQRHMSDRF